jgi:hypothetical protein
MNSDEKNKNKKLLSAIGLQHCLNHKSNLKKNNTYIAGSKGHAPM